MERFCFLNQLGEVMQQVGEIVQQALDMPAATPLRKEETPSPLRGQLGIVMHILLHCSVRDVFDLRANLNEHTPVVSGKLGWLQRSWLHSRCSPHTASCNCFDDAKRFVMTKNSRHAS